ncbi:MAG: hypothetical protein ABIG95_00640 [Candidatus Woesearchaeota archaeon]
MSELQELADRLVSHNFAYQGGRFVLMYEERNKDIAEFVANSIIQFPPRVGNPLLLVNIDEYRQGHPLTELPDSLVDRIQSHFVPDQPENNTLVFINSVLAEEIATFAKIIDLAKPYGRVGNLNGCNAKVLEVAANPMNNPDFVLELADFVRHETGVIITDNLGTNLTLLFDQQYKVVVSDGVLKLATKDGKTQGVFANAMPAEVYTFPAQADGVAVFACGYTLLYVHAAYDNNRQKLFDDFRATPLTWHISDGRITDINCANPTIFGFLTEKIMELDPIYGMHVGEIGFPANLYMLQGFLIGNSFADEKGRFHLCNGHGHPDLTGSPYNSPVHGDALFLEVSVFSLRLNDFFVLNNHYLPKYFQSLRH